MSLEHEMAGHKSDFPLMNSSSEPGVGCTKSSVEASFISPLAVVLHMGANVVAHELCRISQGETLNVYLTVRLRWIERASDPFFSASNMPFSRQVSF